MRILLLVLIAILSFVGTLGGVLFMTGNLSKESLSKLMGGSEGKTPQVVSTSAIQSEDSLMSLIEQIKKKEEELKKKEAELRKKEQELNNFSQQLKEIQSKIEASQNEVAKMMEVDSEDRAIKLQTIAMTLAEMKPDKAAERLKTMPPDDIAEILTYIKPKERGKIVEALDAQLASQVLQSLQKIKPAKSSS